MPLRMLGLSLQAALRGHVELPSAGPTPPNHCCPILLPPPSLTRFSWEHFLKSQGFREFPGGPVARALCFHTAGSMGSIAGRGTKILHAARYGQKKSLGFSVCFWGYPDFWATKEQNCTQFTQKHRGVNTMW